MPAGTQGNTSHYVHVILTCLFMAIPILSAEAGQLQVPGQYVTIQAAIDAAASDDEVVVAPGTYYENLLIRKTITVRSTNPDDPAVVAATIVDGNQSGSVVSLRRGGSSPVVSGLTITHGKASCGAGVDTAIGVEVDYPPYRIPGPVIDRCVITQNEGGGVYNQEWGTVALVRCTISHNVGRGISNGSVAPGTATIRDCIIESNITDWDGGGILASRDSRTTITNCIIRGNQARSGGGICLSQALSTRISGCLISGNSAADWGGGIDVHDSYMMLANCTITQNDAASGGGIYGETYYYYDNWVKVTGCILWGNTASTGAQISLESFWYVMGDGLFTIAASAIQDGPAGIPVNPDAWVLTWGDGNIDADPLLTADCHLAEGSPCINTGDPAYVPAEGQTDLDGQPRVIYDRVDIGADEFLLPGDIDANGTVNIADLQLLIAAWGSTRTGGGTWNPAADINIDHYVNVGDLQLMVAGWNRQMGS